MDTLTQEKVYLNHSKHLPYKQKGLAICKSFFSKKARIVQRIRQYTTIMKVIKQERMRNANELIDKLVHYNGNPKKVGNFKTEYATIPEYGIETDSYLLKFWNSSNTKIISNPKEVVREIGAALKENLTTDENDWIWDGEVHDGWNHIMYEVIAK